MDSNVEVTGMKVIIKDVLDSWRQSLVDWSSKHTAVNDNDSLLSHIGANIKVLVRVDITELNEHGNSNYEALIGKGWELYEKSFKPSTRNNNNISNDDDINNDSDDRNERNNINTDQTGDTSLEGREGYTQIIDSDVKSINDYNDNKPVNIDSKSKNNDHDQNNENSVPTTNNSPSFQNFYFNGTVVQSNWRDPSNSSQIAMVAISAPKMERAAPNPDVEDREVYIHTCILTVCIYICTYSCL
jgi:hypothetical protein